MTPQDARARLERALDMLEACDEFGQCHVCSANVTAGSQHCPTCVYAAAQAYLDATSSRPVAVERARQFLRDSASLPNGWVYVVCGYCHNSTAHGDACPVSIIAALLS